MGPCCFNFLNKTECLAESLFVHQTCLTAINSNRHNKYNVISNIKTKVSATESTNLKKGIILIFDQVGGCFKVITYISQTHLFLRFSSPVCSHKAPPTLHPGVKFNTIRFWLLSSTSGCFYILYSHGALIHDRDRVVPAV